jgi:hypothetical protein
MAKVTLGLGFILPTILYIVYITFENDKAVAPLQRGGHPRRVAHVSAAP